MRKVCPRPANFKMVFDQRKGNKILVLTALPGEKAEKGGEYGNCEETLKNKNPKILVVEVPNGKGRGVGSKKRIG